MIRCGKKKYAIMLLMFFSITTSSIVAPIYGQSRNAVSYEEGMERMAEILGSLHYLDNLCRDGNDAWLQFMNRFIASESLTPSSRTRLIVAFNRAHSAFADHYQHCTKAATQAIKLYREQGTELVGELINRYGR